MGSTAQKLNGTLKRFIEDQPMFFVGTAAETGRVNISPKGMDSLRVMNDNRVVWLNITGSGNETAAHLRRVNRMTLMWCAFQGPANIVRCYGEARVYHAGEADFEALYGLFEPMDGARQIFDMTIDLVQKSCGFGVPLMEIVAQRGPEELLGHFREMGPEATREYWLRKNATSLDGFDTGIAEAVQS
jgi:hypothetical protein